MNHDPPNHPRRSRTGADAAVVRGWRVSVGDGAQVEAAVVSVLPLCRRGPHQSLTPPPPRLSHPPSVNANVQGVSA